MQCSSCYSVIGVHPHGRRSDVRAREGDQKGHTTEEDYQFYQLAMFGDQKLFLDFVVSIELIPGLM